MLVEKIFGLNALLKSMRSIGTLWWPPWGPPWGACAFTSNGFESGCSKRNWATAIWSWIWICRFLSFHFIYPISLYWCIYTTYFLFPSFPLLLNCRITTHKHIETFIHNTSVHIHIFMSSSSWGSIYSVGGIVLFLTHGSSCDEG